MILFDLSSQPDSFMIPLGFVRKHFVPKQDAACRDMTTVELAAEFGHSADWWRSHAPKIAGSYKASPQSPWYIPRQHAILFLDEYKAQKSRRGRPPAVPQRTLVGSGFAAVGRSKTDAAESLRSQRRKNRESGYRG